jgi:phosphorylcholine metabolism protein LicD
LAAGRWTPPCCIAHLKETAQYVFDRLDAAGVRWWLEGGSLLGAARNGDLIPWDYDVDVGIRSEDIAKCAELALLDTVPHSTTAEGYIWEKAREGGFYRVQYSAYNHLHVDIFPFHLDGETIAKGSWATGHKQDTSFPVKLLEPLTQLPFIGRTNASVPADYRAFLEYKFGKGVIESPMYPS